MTRLHRNFLIIYILKLVFLSQVAYSQNDNFDLKDPLAIEATLGHLRSGNVRKAVERLHLIGESGNIDAFFHLGEIYRGGILGQPNFDLAKKYYLFAALGGHGRAALSRANLLFFGESPSRNNVREAISVWQKYALLGEGEALFLLGSLLWNGDGGLPQDPLKGYGMVWLAASNGYSPAIEPELTMAGFLSFEEKQEGRQYARNFGKFEFARKSITLSAILKGLAEPEFKNIERPNPVSWRYAWHIELGEYTGIREAVATKDAYLENSPGVFAGLKHAVLDAAGQNVAVNQNIEAKELQTLNDTQPQGGENSRRFRLVFGPFLTMEEAAIRCTIIRHGGRSCFVGSPE